MSFFSSMLSKRSRVCSEVYIRTWIKLCFCPEVYFQKAKEQCFSFSFWKYTSEATVEVEKEAIFLDKLQSKNAIDHKMQREK